MTGRRAVPRACLRSRTVACWQPRKATRSVGEQRTPPVLSCMGGLPAGVGPDRSNPTHRPKQLQHAFRREANNSFAYPEKGRADGRYGRRLRLDDSRDTVGSGGFPGLPPIAICSTETTVDNHRSRDTFATGRMGEGLMKYTVRLRVSPEAVQLHHARGTVRHRDPSYEGGGAAEPWTE